MFKNTRPTLGGVGMRLMQKMGWRPGEGLGPNGMGATEPLLMDVKNDRKGLVSQDDKGAESVPVMKSAGVPGCSILCLCCNIHVLISIPS
ncbi:unnamed protein product [Angiostrongylus costaricensis]|uniref:G-patch domain-containing protein n=1 Tax=Angiostrongylus costaricensis TaxID=334426 RepID=A0A0R3PNC9_ANGCS|nr:unnamed protein product [Angiostrongylus costaricensis]